MKYLTKKHYRIGKGITRQAVNDRIKRGTLHLVPGKIDAMVIPVEDAEWEEMQARLLAKEQGQE